MLQHMTFDSLAIDARAIGTAKILYERILAYSHNDRVLPTDRKIIQLDIIGLQAPYGNPLLGQRVLTDKDATQRKYKLCHMVNYYLKPLPASLAFEFVRTRLCRQLVQHPVDILMAISAAVALGQFHPFIDSHAVWNAGIIY